MQRPRIICRYTHECSRAIALRDCSYYFFSFSYSFSSYFFSSFFSTSSFSSSSSSFSLLFLLLFLLLFFFFCFKRNGQNCIPSIILRRLLQTGNIPFPLTLQACTRSFSFPYPFRRFNSKHHSPKLPKKHWIMTGNQFSLYMSKDCVLTEHVRLSWLLRRRRHLYKAIGYM